MSNWLIYSIGFIAQIFFAGRLITQWFLSEKARKVQTPSLFWKLSLLASLLMFIYGYFRHDLSIMLGQVLIYTVYIRNLQLQGKWSGSNIILKITTISFPLIIAIYFLFISNLRWSELVHREKIAPWLLFFGISGQIIFNGRFIYQWLYSEKFRQSSLPLGFWLLSLFGAMLIFTYGIFRKDPVLMASHSFGSLIYLRNIYFLKKSMA